MKATHANITKLSVDAIVNAANSRLLGGGGVDGAIHKAAGKELLEACRKLYRCKVGEAKITPGFKLPARYIIHTVGPVWNGGNSQEPELLASCYARSCEIAMAQEDIHSIAFPCISTGSYRFPFETAAQIAIETCSAYAKDLEITFCCFSEKEAESYSLHLSSLS